jgi:nucleolar protein 14
VFEVPTTLDSLHDLIATFASTGKDASTIIERIHSSNSVRLDRRNMEKMQNFYDVCLRRFIAVGDAIYASGGDGGPELGRFGQLDALTKILYDMAQDAPESAGAVWARRIGIFQNAHAKRLRDAAFIRDEGGGGDDEDDDDHSAWPSTGIILTLRAVGHIFPVTDKKHYVVTPALLLLGQMIAQTPAESMYDIVIGSMCAALLIQYTKDAKRLAPEAHAFLAGVIRLFAAEPSKRSGPYPTPSLDAAINTKDKTVFAELRKKTSQLAHTETPPRLSLEKSAIQSNSMPAAVLFTALSLVEQSAQNLTGALGSAEEEVFAEITESLLALQPKHSSAPLPAFLLEKVASVASVLRVACETETNRAALCRRIGASATAHVRSIKTLAPRLEDPERFGPLSQKKHKKTASQTALAQTRAQDCFSRIAFGFSFC